jgi:hypothetical protein
MRCTAILVTRGNVPLDEIVTSCQDQETFRNGVIWDNSKHLNFNVFGRYVAATQMQNLPVIYFQDDDCVTDPAAIVKQWEPGKIVCNMPIALGHRANYENQLDKLMGFGSVCERSLIKETFERYWKYFPIDQVCLREADRIFTGLNAERIKLVDVPVRNLEWATAPDRLYREPGHQGFLGLARERVRAVLFYESGGLKPNTIWTANEAAAAQPSTPEAK